MNFHATDPTKWLDIYDPLQITAENRSFYTPFTADPKIPGRLFTGLQHVWRTDDSGGNEQALAANGCYAVALDPNRTKPCGDWVPIGADLTDTTFGNDRTGQYVVADERAPSDTGTMWAGTRTGRVFVTSNADAAPAAGAVLPDRLPDHARPLRVGDRDRSEQPRSRLGVLLRVQRVHARHPRARVRRAL